MSEVQFELWKFQAIPVGSEMRACFEQALWRLSTTGWS